MATDLNFGSQARSTRTTSFFIAAFIFLLAFLGLIYNRLTTWPGLQTSSGDELQSHPQPTGSAPPSQSSSEANQDSGDQDADLNIDAFFSQIWTPSVKPDSPTYKPFNSFEHKLPDGDVNFKEPLGERLCIIDMDNRSWNESGEVWSEKMSWDEPVRGQSLGVLQHWMYAKIHGYKYYFVSIQEPEDRRSSWMKPPIITKLLEKHDVCIYLDSDAVFFHPDLPMEWLMNYWAIDPSRDLLSLAEDPKADYNKDKFGKLNWNTGFIISHNNPTTYDIMADWWDCPSENSKHPDCPSYRFAPPGRPTDQGGFGDFVRYDWQSYIKMLPCSEANGYLGSNTECVGRFIAHVWTGKNSWLNQFVGEQMPGRWLELLHGQFLEEKDKFFLKQEDVL